MGGHIFEMGNRWGKGEREWGANGKGRSVYSCVTKNVLFGEISELSQCSVYVFPMTILKIIVSHTT